MHANGDKDRRTKNEMCIIEIWCFFTYVAFLETPVRPRGSMASHEPQAFLRCSPGLVQPISSRWT